MYIVLTVFLTSFAALCGMIVFRWLEIKKGRVAVAADATHRPLFSKEETTRLREACYTCIPKQLFSRIREKLLHYGRFGAEKLITIFKNSSARQCVEKFINGIHGRHTVERTKPSSAFIEDILAHKAQIRNNNRSGGA